jgi:predicted phosphoadenosine phosphosulfate sulfurtransferase
MRLTLTAYWEEIFGGVYMGKVFHNQNVLEAFKDRMEFIFSKFDHIVVAFSGGKDSGLMLELLNLCCEERKPSLRVSVYHIDYEGNYQYIIDYVSRCMGKYPHFDYYHLCIHTHRPQI